MVIPDKHHMKLFLYHLLLKRFGTLQTSGNEQFTQIKNEEKKNIRQWVFKW